MQATLKKQREENEKNGIIVDEKTAKNSSAAKDPHLAVPINRRVEMMLEKAKQMQSSSEEEDSSSSESVDMEMNTEMIKKRIDLLNKRDRYLKRMESHRRIKTSKSSP